MIKELIAIVVVVILLSGIGGSIAAVENITSKQMSSKEYVVETHKSID